MQGRLSPIIDGKIQSFPWNNWENEIAQSFKLGLGMMEWTLDQKDLYLNPLLTEKGQIKIKNLSKNYKLKIPSLTGDCFMQFPFWKIKKDKSKKLKNDFLKIVEACNKIGIGMIVLPLVDNGKIENKKQEDSLFSFLNECVDFLKKNKMKVIFESDLPPKKLSKFIDKFDDSIFGINYDIGNSASMGFDCIEEIKSYGRRILNIHVKDRLINGTTVPLGEGNANFKQFFSELSKISYKGNFILQTARAADGNHDNHLMKYYNMTDKWLNKYNIE